MGRKVCHCSAGTESNLMKILVTGASGFIGSHCCAQLSALGYEVHAVSSKSQSDETVHWQKTDLLDSQQSIRLIRNIQPTHLLHLAWCAEPGKYWNSIENYHWVKASLTLFEEFLESGGKRVVVAGSCAEYDWGFDDFYEDKTPLAPATLYGTCKNSLQLMLSAYASLNGLSFAWGRVFSVYGPGEHPNRLVASVVRSLLQGQKVNIDNGCLVRDYLHVNDVASAFVALINNDIKGPVNIGSGSGISLKDLAEKIEKKIGIFGCLKLNSNTTSKADAEAIIANIQLIKSIGWQQFYNLDTGLEDTINWFKKN
jgi:nucleoside-diphosphate-sugar epimerase